MNAGFRTFFVDKIHKLDEKPVFCFANPDCLCTFVL
jgi:hypothetical protein